MAAVVARELPQDQFSDQPHASSQQSDTEQNKLEQVFKNPDLISCKKPKKIIRKKFFF